MTSDDMALPAEVALAADLRPTRRVDPPGAAAGRGLALAVLAGLDDAGVRWCLLRGGPEGLTAADDLDILVAAADLAGAVDVIEAHGLIRLRSHGRGTHMFFVGFDPATSTWVEFDLVTEIAYGRHFEVRTAAADECLARRQRQHGRWVLAPADEFWALLLHSVLDRRALAVHHVRRLKQLEPMTSLDNPLVRAMPLKAELWTLLERWRTGHWAAFPALRRALLAAWWRAHPVSSTRRLISSAALRLVERPLQAWSRRGVSVAILGPDGSGKSTLAEGIQSTFYFPVHRVYMGLWSSKEEPRGGTASVLRILLRPFTVWRRYLSSLHHRTLGRVVVFDRYVYDALLPPRGPMVWLKRPYFRLLSRLCPAPNLVLLLDVPGPVMHLRSGEYDPEHLEAEREQYQRLRRRIPHLAHVDGHRPPGLVLADALALIWQLYLTREAR
jgi:thymidylate kinase